MRSPLHDSRSSLLQGLPHIGIVTPSFNQGSFIGETIESVLSQQYPRLSYVVIDGGSTDVSIDILRSYGKRLTAWLSEPDQGQADAINKGFRMLVTDVQGWVNSDDLLEQGALWKVARAFSQLGFEDPLVLAGESGYLGNGRRDSLRPLPHSGLKEVAVSAYSLLTKGKPGHQPSTFWTRSAWHGAGPLDSNLHFAFDTDFWIRLHKTGSRFYYLPEQLAWARDHPESKSVSRRQEWGRELGILAKRHLTGLERTKFTLGTLIWEPSLSRAYASWQATRFDRKKATKLLISSFFKFPPGFLKRPRVFGAAAFRILVGWKNHQ